MAGTLAKAMRRAGVLQRLSDRLGIKQADLQANAKGDPELALIITLERVADALETNQQAQERGDLRSVIAAASDEELIALPGIGEKSLETLRAWAAQPPEQESEQKSAPQEDVPPPVTVETVVEKPLETVETVEIVPADAPSISAMGAEVEGKNETPIPSPDEVPVDVPEDAPKNKGKRT